MRSVAVLFVAWVALLLSSGCSSPKPLSDEDLVKKAMSATPYDREQAVYAMMRSYKPKFFNVLQQLAIDTDVSVRRAVLKNVAQTKDRRFIPILEQYKTASDIEDRKTAEEARAELEKVPSSQGL